MSLGLESATRVDDILPSVLPIKVLSTDAHGEGGYVRYYPHAQQSDARRRWRTAEVPDKL